MKTAAHIALTPTSKKLPDSKIFFIGTGCLKSVIENPLKIVKKNLKDLIQTTIEYSTTNFPVSQLSKLICLKIIFDCILRSNICLRSADVHCFISSQFDIRVIHYVLHNLSDIILLYKICMFTSMGTLRRRPVRIYQAQNYRFLGGFKVFLEMPKLTLVSKLESLIRGIFSCR